MRRRWNWTTERRRSGGVGRGGGNGGRGREEQGEAVELVVMVVGLVAMVVVEELLTLVIRSHEMLVVDWERGKRGSITAPKKKTKRVKKGEDMERLNTKEPGVAGEGVAKEEMKEEEMGPDEEETDEVEEEEAEDEE